MTILDNIIQEIYSIFVSNEHAKMETEVNKRYCQSCGMPLRFDVEEYLGTNADQTRSDEYCYYCLKDGKYIVDISMNEMIDIWIKYTDKYNEYSGTNYSPEELKLVLNKRLTTLNRWRQKLKTEIDTSLNGINYRNTQNKTN